MTMSELLDLAHFRILDKRNSTEEAKDRLLGQMADEIERLTEAGRCPVCSRWLEQRCPVCGPARGAEHCDFPDCEQHWKAVVGMCDAALGQWLHDFGSTNELSQRTRIIRKLIADAPGGAVKTSRDETPAECQHLPTQAAWCPKCSAQKTSRDETPVAQTKTPEWHAALVAEIAAQNALIERMDYPPNREMWNNGIMNQLRQERLDLLQKLLEFEPAFSEKTSSDETASPYAVPTDDEIRSALKAAALDQGMRKR